MGGLEGFDMTETIASLSDLRENVAFPVRNPGGRGHHPSWTTDRWATHLENCASRAMIWIV
jgi:hypothetical protein